MAVVDMMQRRLRTPVGNTSAKDIEAARRLLTQCSVYGMPTEPRELTRLYQAAWLMKEKAREDFYLIVATFSELHFWCFEKGLFDD